MNRLFTAKWSFFLIVVLPTLLTAIYSFFLATPFYYSEAKIIVKSLGGQEALGGFAGVLRSIGVLEHGTLGPYVVIDYLTSRDFMFDLDKKFSIKKHYSSDKIDMLQRFDPLNIDSSYENFYKNYFVGNVIRVSLNPNSSIITISYRSPDPRYAKSLAEWTVMNAETFVNSINERAFEMRLSYFNTRVEETKGKIRQVADRVKGFIKSTNVLSPEQQAGALLQTVVRLQEQLLLRQMELAKIQSVAPDNPRIPELRREIESLQRSINENMSKLAQERNALGPSAVELEMLKMELQILQKELEANMVSLIQAVNQFRLQQFFLERIESPRVADAPTDPRRARNILTVFAVTFAIWGVLAVLYSGVREHAGR